MWAAAVVVAAASDSSSSPTDLGPRAEATPPPSQLEACEAQRQRAVAAGAMLRVMEESSEHSEPSPMAARIAARTCRGGVKAEGGAVPPVG